MIKSLNESQDSTNGQDASRRLIFKQIKTFKHLCTTYIYIYIFENAACDFYLFWERERMSANI